MKTIYSFFFISFLLNYSTVIATSSDVFSFDSDEQRVKCAVTLSGTSKKGIKWIAKSIQVDDIPYHQKAFNNPIIMSGFASGMTRDFQSTHDRITQQWIPRFDSGHPHGGLTIFNSDTGEIIGHFVAGGGEGTVVSEIAYTLMEDSWNGQGVPSIWGQGVMSSVLENVVTRWAPEVMRIGTSSDVPEDIRNRFCCFADSSLQRFDATASPNNKASWYLLRKHGFVAARSKVLGSVVAEIDMEETENLEDSILKLFDASDQEHKLQDDTRYQFSSVDGELWTFSYSSRFERVKLHFELLL